MHPRTMLTPALVGATVAALTLLAACGSAPKADTAATSHDSGYPVKITSCAYTSTVTAPPKRAVTLNQGATEVMLALGLQDRMAGTAYLDDSVASKYQKAYDSVKVLSKEYPSQETFLAAKPDFAYASYGSAFDAKAVGTQKQLTGEGIASYLSPFGCADDSQRPQASFQAVWDEIDAVAKVFDVTRRAEALEAEQKKELAQAKATDAGKGLRVFWYDSDDGKVPYAGAGQGGPQLVLDAVGATNVFSSLKGGWADVSWEKVVAADPDVIVLGDASWSTATSKITSLEKDPVLSKLTAVKDKRFVVVPFSETTPGVRLADGAVQVSKGLQDLQDQ